MFGSCRRRLLFSPDSKLASDLAVSMSIALPLDPAVGEALPNSDVFDIEDVAAIGPEGLEATMGDSIDSSSCSCVGLESVSKRSSIHAEPLPL